MCVCVCFLPTANHRKNQPINYLHTYTVYYIVIYRYNEADPLNGKPGVEAKEAASAASIKLSFHPKQSNAYITLHVFWLAILLAWP